MTKLKAPMDCRGFRKNHFAYLDDTLSGNEMAAAQRHILQCDGCAAHDTMVRRSLMVVRSMPTIEPSASFHDRLQARLAECREERGKAGALGTARATLTDAEIMGFSTIRPGWRTPRTLAAIAASAMIGALIWRSAVPSQAVLVASEPAIVAEPMAPEQRFMSPALLQAMATGSSPVWPSAALIDEMPSQFVTVDYSMALDGR